MMSDDLDYREQEQAELASLKVAYSEAEVAAETYYRHHYWPANREYQRLVEARLEIEEQIERLTMRPHKRQANAKAQERLKRSDKLSLEDWLRVGQGKLIRQTFMTGTGREVAPPSYINIDFPLPADIEIPNRKDFGWYQDWLDQLASAKNKLIERLEERPGVEWSLTKNLAITPRGICQLPVMSAEEAQVLLSDEWDGSFSAHRLAVSYLESNARRYLALDKIFVVPENDK
jgi:hypothetical protein